MAQLDPQKDLSKLDKTDYGEVAVQIAGKSTIKTQSLTYTNYGQVMSGNDFVSGTVDTPFPVNYWLNKT